MTTRIPRPTSPPPLDEVTSQEQQGLLRGVALERSRPWKPTLLFGLVAMPVLWLLLTGLFGFIGRGAWALLDGLAWSLLVSTGLALVFHLAYPLLLDPPVLRLRNQILQLHASPQHHWTLSLDEPFAVHLLYRDEREDALLIVQTSEAPPLFFYGRYRHHRALPYAAIPITPLGFSLAEIALDQVGAWMMPDRNEEYLPPLCALLMDEPGYDPYDYALPLAPAPHTLRMGEFDITWFQGNERVALYPHSELIAQPFLPPASLPAPQASLLLSLEAPGEETAWLALQWPLPLALDHLPHAPSLSPTHTLSTLDTVLFLHMLNRKGVLPGALALLQHHTPTPDSEAEPEEERYREAGA